VITVVESFKRKHQLNKRKSFCRFFSLSKSPSCIAVKCHIVKKFQKKAKTVWKLVFQKRAPRAKPSSCALFLKVWEFAKFLKRDYINDVCFCFFNVHPPVFVTWCDLYFRGGIHSKFHRKRLKKPLQKPAANATCRFQECWCQWVWGNSWRWGLVDGFLNWSWWLLTFLPW